MKIYYYEKLKRTKYRENKIEKTIIGMGLNINEDYSIDKQIPNSICINLNKSKKEIIIGIYEKSLSKNDEYEALIGLNSLERSEKSEYISSVKAKY